MKAAGSYFKQAICALFFVWAMAIAAASSTSGQKKDEAAPLPEGEGRSLMLQACVQCHDFKSIVSQRKTAAAWRRTVNEMIWRGAPLLADEAAIITNYLAAAFGPEVPLLNATAKSPVKNEGEDQWAKYLPSGKGRALVLRACVQCHGLKTVVAQRNTAAGWRRSVNEMVKLGSPLMAGEAMVVAKYLAVSFGPKVPIPDELKKR